MPVSPQATSTGRAAPTAQQEGFRITANEDGLTVTPTAPATGQSTGQQFPPIDFIPSEAVTISLAFFIMCAVIIIGFPIARAIARRMDRRGVAPALPSDLGARVERIEQAVDAIAIEVERISEGQRFTNKLMSERRELETGAVERGR